MLFMIFLTSKLSSIFSSPTASLNAEQKRFLSNLGLSAFNTLETECRTGMIAANCCANAPAPYLQLVQLSLLLEPDNVS